MRLFKMQTTSPLKHTMKRRWRRTVCCLLAVSIMVATSLGFYTWLHWSPEAPVYSSNGMSAINLPIRFRNGVEHDTARQRNGGNPYILEIQSADRGAMLYYGASHTRDSNHPQIADIETRWHNFKPTVALCEGRARGYFFGALIEPFAGLPEPALIHKLARRDGVRLYSLEPSYEVEVATLLTRFEPEQVTLYFFHRVYASESRGVANERLAVDLLAKRTNVQGLRGSLPSVAAVTGVVDRIGSVLLVLELG